MQRLHEDDPTGEWLSRSKGDKIKHICLPAELSDKVSPPEIVEKYINGLLDPIRLSVSVLKESKEDLGEFGYASQFDQNPVPRGGGEFKTSMIDIQTVPPFHFVRKVRYWDKAATKDAGAYTVGVLMGRDRDGFFWILDVIRKQWDSSERERIIKQTAEIDGVSVRVYVEQEPGSGGKESAERTVRMLAGFNAYADRPTGSKEARAEPFAAQVTGGGVKMVRAPWNRDYINELMYWPMSKYKDQVDASSGAFMKLTEGRKRAGALR